MKVTMVQWPDRSGSPLYDVLIDGKPIGSVNEGSRGRVLKSPWGFMPIHDDYNIPAVLTCKTRKQAAAFVANVDHHKDVYWFSKGLPDVTKPVRS